MPGLTINELMLKSNETAVKKGFWDEFAHIPAIDKKYFITTKLALVMTEISEAVEALRVDGRAGDHFTEELADAMIRISDLAQQLNLPLERALFDKMERNAGRPRLHGKRF